MSYRFNAPPGWPAPPPGWWPPPGWRPDPTWPPAPVGWQFWTFAGSYPAPVGAYPAQMGGYPAPLAQWERRRHRWALDEQVRECDARAGRAWTSRVGWLPLVVVVLSVVGTQLVGRAVLSSLGSAGLIVRVALYLAITVAGYALMLYACYRVGRPVAQACGGMANAFGWRRPSLPDLGIGVLWSIASYIVRVIIVIVIVMAVPALRNAHSSNLTLPHHASSLGIAALGLLAVFVAPPIEELVFRGLLLRTAMRAMSFWPAAILSSVLFGAMHTYEVNTVAGATILGVSIAVFGLGQCLLVRWRGNLGAAMTAHGVSNGVALLLAVAATR